MQRTNFHFSYKYYGKVPYRQTYHPMEEFRIRREIDGFRGFRSPFSYARFYHISRNTQVRLIESLVEKFGLPHPRLLEKSHFLKPLPGFKATMRHFYGYYEGLRPKDGRRTVDFMLDELDIPRLDELPVDEQIRLLSYRGKFLWDQVSLKIKKRLFERAAEEADFLHPRMLTLEELERIVIPELGTTILGLYYRYEKLNPDQKHRMMDFVLDEVGIEKFESLTDEVQFKILKEIKYIQWKRVPPSTQVKLLNLLRVKAKNKNNMECPHLRAFISENFRDVLLTEINGTLNGLLNYWTKQKPKSYKNTDIDYMFDKLGIEKFDDLSFETQCRCLRYIERWPWSKLSKKTVRKLLDIARQRANPALPHIRFMGFSHLEKIFLEEIEKTLHTLVIYIREVKDPSDKRDLADVLFDHYEVPEMPFSLKIEWTKLPGTSVFTWRRTDPEAIGHYLHTLSQEAGKASPLDLRSPAFDNAVLGREAGLTGLYSYLRRIAPETVKGKEFYRWVFETFGQGPVQREIELRDSIERKRQKREFLTKDESMFLTELAKDGDMQAMNDLLFFYEPMLAGMVSSALKRFPKSRKEFADLMQIVRMEFVRAVERYDSKFGSLANYLKHILPWYLFSAINRDTGNIHIPVYLLDERSEVNKIKRKLGRELGRAPTMEEIAEEFGMGVEEFRERHILMQTKSDISLNKPVFDDDISLIDTIGDEFDPALLPMLPHHLPKRPDQKLMEADKFDKIDEAIENSELTEAEKYIIRERLKERTFEDIGRDFDLSGERIRQLEAKAIKKLGEGPYREILKSLYF